jgi:hypothetical protein
LSLWPSIADVAARLYGEADAHAARLGHKLTSWSPIAARASAARCTLCGDIARITVRVPGKAAIEGPATQLPCSGPTRGR